VRLRPLALLDESDDVFGEEAEPTGRPRKAPPPVPEKTAAARQTARLMTRTRRRGPLAADKEIIYSRVVKPQAGQSQREAEPKGPNARVTGK